MIEGNKKTRYYDFGEAVIASLHGERKKLLFHVCCGPCACFPLTYLCPHFDVTIYYCNPNIYPSEEYERRLGELKKLLEYLKRDYRFEIELVVPPYDPEAYYEFIKPYEHLPEGSERCHHCYEYRMDEAYQYAVDHHFDYFTTVMTVSRQKSSVVLNEVGRKLEAQHPSVPYLYTDFKKKDGALKGVKIRDHYGLYNQQYCGCRASYEEYLKRKADC